MDEKFGQFHFNICHFLWYTSILFLQLFLALTTKKEFGSCI